MGILHGECTGGNGKNREKEVDGRATHHFCCIRLLAGLFNVHGHLYRQKMMMKSIHFVDSKRQ